MAMRLFRAIGSQGSRFAWEVKDGDRPFTCPSCGVSVEHVNSYITKGEDARLRREVPACFRLTKGESHKDTCSHSVPGAVSILMRESEAVEDRAEPEFEVDRGQIKFRLNIPTVIAKKVKAASSEESFGQRTGRILKEGRLDNFVRSAVGLAQIWNAIEGSNERSQLSELVKIADRSKELSWSRFFYSPKSYPTLLKSLKDGGRSVAVLVSINEIYESAGDDEISLVHCSSVVLDAKTNTQVAPSLWIPNGLAERLVVNAQYIAFGFWRETKPNEWESQDKTRKILYRNVTLNIERAAQFARVLVPSEDDLEA